MSGTKLTGRWRCAPPSRLNSLVGHLLCSEPLRPHPKPLSQKGRGALKRLGSSGSPAPKLGEG
ncbi:MAG: hypothetical protein VKK04_21995, partial [Synechococcales bacterium]|nr:hypothetical protein [Synechococcales bacterium]